MNERETDQYVLTKTEMLRIADIIGESTWRFTVSRLIEGTGIIGSLFVVAVMLLVQLYVEKEPSRLVCVVFWVSLGLSASLYLLLRHRLSRLKKTEFCERARKGMLEDMESARVRSEIERLTSGEF